MWQAQLETELSFPGALMPLGEGGHVGSQWFLQPEFWGEGVVGRASEESIPFFHGDSRLPPGASLEQQLSEPQRWTLTPSLSLSMPHLLCWETTAGFTPARLLRLLFPP